MSAVTMSEHSPQNGPVADEAAEGSGGDDVVECIGEQPGNEDKMDVACRNCGRGGHLVRECRVNGGGSHRPAARESGLRGVSSDGHLVRVV